MTIKFNYYLFSFFHGKREQNSERKRGQILKNPLTKRVLCGIIMSIKKARTIFVYDSDIRKGEFLYE